MIEVLTVVAAAAAAAAEKQVLRTPLGGCERQSRNALRKNQHRFITNSARASAVAKSCHRLLTTVAKQRASCLVTTHLRSDHQ